MILNKNVSSMVIPKTMITQFKVFIPKNIIENKKTIDDVQYTEYIYDEEEYTVQEYILNLNAQIYTLNDITDCLILESLK